MYLFSIFLTDFIITKNSHLEREFCEKVIAKISFWIFHNQAKRSFQERFICERLRVLVKETALRLLISKKTQF